MNIHYKYLSGIELEVVFAANIEAFSDYFVPMEMTKEDFRNHLMQNAVDLSMSVGAFSDGKLIGYTLNGFGDWDGVSTVYDAGTGVVPEYRRQGIGTALFEFMLSTLKEIGTQQMLLEVLTNNEKAIDLYRKIGFEKSRTLNFYEQTSLIKSRQTKKLRLKVIDEPDWKFLSAFGDVASSWQYSQESFGRSIAKKEIIGAFWEDACVGFAALFPISGSIGQLAVQKNYRRRGIGSNLVSEMQARIQSEKKLRFSNVDENLEGIPEFCASLGFKQGISQFEMILRL